MDLLQWPMATGSLWGSAWHVSGDHSSFLSLHLSPPHCLHLIAYGTWRVQVVITKCCSSEEKAKSKWKGGEKVLQKKGGNWSSCKLEFQIIIWLAGQQFNVLKRHTHIHKQSLTQQHRVRIWQPLFGVCYPLWPVGTIKCHSPLSEEERQLHPNSEHR